MHMIRMVSGGRLVTIALAIPAVALIGQTQVSAANAPPPPGTYSQVNLVSDLPGVAAITDKHLVNPWGMSASATSPIWVSDNGTGVSTLYDGNGTPFPPKPSAPLVVHIPAPHSAGPGATSAPTGQVFNSAGGFVVTKRGVSGSSVFIFATEGGTIAGWNPNVDLTHAVTAVDRSGAVDPGGDVGAVYKGLASATTPAGTFLYATNFRFGQVEMFDSNFNLVKTFTDPHVTAGFVPFGIHNIGGNLYVTFALQNAEKKDDVSGPGNGYVDVFSPNGDLIHRLTSHGRLNSPWAVTLAPPTFGRFAGDILVGNFGDGRITAYGASSGLLLGQLTNAVGQRITIPGLWDLMFGNGAHDAGTNALYFTAGLNGEADGLFGDLVSNG